MFASRSINLSPTTQSLPQYILASHGTYPYLTTQSLLLYMVAFHCTSFASHGTNPWHIITFENTYSLLGVQHKASHGIYSPLMPFIRLLRHTSPPNALCHFFYTYPPLRIHIRFPQHHIRLSRQTSFTTHIRLLRHESPFIAHFCLS